MLVIVGPTASGKSEVALEIAASAGADLLSVDSVQVYRDMDIGTAKPGRAERARVRHHLIDIADPEDDYTVAEFQEEGRAVLDPLVAGGVPVVVVGGSGLHMRALLDPLEFPPSDPGVRAAVDVLAPDDAVAELLAGDPDAGRVVDLANPRRVQRSVEIMRLGAGTPTERHRRPSAAAVRAYVPRTDFVGVGIDPGDLLEARIRRRFGVMLERGLVEEVDGLRSRLGRNAAQAVGYKELLPALAGECSMEDAVEGAISATLALARRQRTFFRRDPRIRWIEWHDDPAERIERVRRLAQEGVAWIS